MTYSEALAYLDAHASYEKTGRIESPTIERIKTIVEAMGDPQFAYPVIHVTGTNGKGSTSQMITRLLMAHGLTVGTYTSPHLERPNERMSRDGEYISDDDFAGRSQRRSLEANGVRRVLETTTAAALRGSLIGCRIRRHRVGVLGRWDQPTCAKHRSR